MPTPDNPEPLIVRRDVETVESMVRRLLILDSREVADSTAPGVRTEATFVGARSRNTASTFTHKVERVHGYVEEIAVRNTFLAVGDPLFVAIARGIEAVAKAVCPACNDGEVEDGGFGKRIYHRYPRGDQEYPDGPIVWQHRFYGRCRAGLLWDAVGVAGVSRLILADDAHERAKARAISPKVSVRM